jgi:RNA polymerase sigma-70 factor (ECF subfamily)
MANEGNDRVQFEWLALRCQTGDPEGFADLIAVMERPLLYYATSLTGNQDAALDVLQDVWLKVLRGIRRLKEPRLSEALALRNHPRRRCRSHPP